jgi:hypothetical protein
MKKADMETLLARRTGEAASYRRSLKKTHNRLRLLENRVRNVVVVGERIDTDALYALRQMVPNKPRKKLT